MNCARRGCTSGALVRAAFTFWATVTPKDQRDTSNGVRVMADVPLCRVHFDEAKMGGELAQSTGQYANATLTKMGKAPLDLDDYQVEAEHILPGGPARRGRT